MKNKKNGLIAFPALLRCFKPLSLSALKFVSNFELRISNLSRVAASTALVIGLGVPSTYALAANAEPHQSTNPSIHPSGNPYQAIVDRNVFALKPMPPPVAANAADANKPPLPPIALTGIIKFGAKKALLSIQMPAEKGQPAKPPQSFMLAEGERDSDVECIEIDDKAGSVKLNVFGTITNVPFAQVAKTSAPGPGSPAPNPSGIPAPPRNPFSPAAGTFNRSIPTRTLRLPSTAPGAGQPGSASLDGANPALGASGFGTSGNVQGSGVNPAAAYPERTPEETVALYEANRLKNEALIQQGVHLPHMPQHPYLKGIGGGGAPAPQ